MILYLGNKLTSHGNTLTSVETLGQKIKDLGYDVITKSSERNKLLRLVDMLLSILKYRKKNPVVLIDTYSTSAFWFAWASAIFCNFLNIKYIPILRGGDLPLRLQKSPRACAQLFIKSYMNVSVSEYLKTEFGKWNYKSFTIHNYLNLEDYPVKIRREIKPNLLWVRSFHEIYNPKMALDVFKKLLTKYPEASLTMVGPDKDGSLSECKKIVLDENLNVTFTGRLSKKDWIGLANNFDIFINTTNVDNTPVSVMEAMALGMIVVTTNAGGIPYLFTDEEHGIMVDKNDADTMAAAIISLLENPDKSEKLSIAASNKTGEWDWKNIGPKWKVLLDNAISGKQLL